MSHSIEHELPPDIIEAALPYLSTQDIKNLSLTNRYFHKLLDFGKSNTLWHELFHKSFGSTHSDAEPLVSQQNHEYMSCSEAILRNRHPDKSWCDLYKLRSHDVRFYTWGCLKHARLGFTSISHGSLPASWINNAGMRLQFGVNTPVAVPWFEDEGNEKSPEADQSIACISGGGFSFQVLTRSGKLYMTGSTYSGGHKGPGPREGEHDFNSFQQIIMDTERSLTFFNGRIPHGRGALPFQGNSSATLEAPHENIYANFEDVERILDQKIPGNKHMRRLFTREVIKVERGGAPVLSVDATKLDVIKFTSVSSGRSHILALSAEGNVYSWDGPDVEQGVKIAFEGLPTKETNPVIKIGCGWNFNCVSIYNLGLVVWESREPIRENETSAGAHYKVIPSTGQVSGEGKIVDFACCANMSVFFISAAGDKLWRYANETVDEVKLPFHGKLVKLVGSYTTLAIFTENHCYAVKVTEGHMRPETFMELELDDENEKLISLSTGDYHTVALTSSGKIYTWGLESELCGCLGLGSRDEIVNERRVGRIENLRSTLVLKPSKVKIGDSDYTCVAITAGGWQTGALIVK
ncbi:SCF ubiquitin ligase complex subunit SAF1 [Lachancea thermotolerans CBS 6340]|uniref:KLTH0H10978p n=1 Tax=Lachancea thermotolerans (strain ATCC 56472 / CBS 6340 / NRRL Y-8284) TaxID=559295 RepID=C5E376_LACTC|nr:KLTH0H10978p [Lachancea thermotolerans CBS 6340]CAR30487.1 KLTH0H10978p [Lachancea thermotolerans CBS 6340]